MSPLAVQVLTEMQDRNFEVILFLSAWSPVHGMREEVLQGESRTEEVIAVIGGAWVALMARLLLIGLVRAFRGWLESFAIVFSPIMLWILCYRAIKDYRVANDNRHDKPSVAAQKMNEPLAQEMSPPELAPPPQPTSPDRFTSDGIRLKPGEMDLGAANKEFGLTPWNRGPVSMAFFVTLACTFMVSISDPLRGMTYLDGGFTAGLLGSILGALVAAILAVAAGTALEYVLSDRRYLLATSVCMGLFATSATARTILFFWVGKN